METPVLEKAAAKTEAELIETVANIQDAERSLLFGQRAIKAGMPALAAACEERAKALTPIKPPRGRNRSPSKRQRSTRVSSYPQDDVAVALRARARPSAGQGFPWSIAGSPVFVPGVLAPAFKPVTVTLSEGWQRLTRTCPK